MKSWSDIRKKLEQEYLAPSLRGRVQYMVTRYHNAHDEEGRIAICVDGREVFQSSVFQMYSIEMEAYSWVEEHYPETDYLERWRRVNQWLQEKGAADQSSVYLAFQRYDNQSIELSLCDEYALVRIFAILDRRVGKRRLSDIKERGFDQEPEWVQYFFRLRLEAEHI